MRIAGAAGRHRDDLLADGVAGDAFAERAHGAGDLEAGNERRLRHAGPVFVQALAEEQVDEADRGMGDVDRQLARTGRRIRHVDECEHTRLAELSDLNGFHDCLLTRAT
jgi:hypothetical protein